LLVTHGTLHLLGFDDQGPVEETRMRREEARILEKLKGLL
jgi:ssRNA-specific RNase YbeY (16S rRNA maturation enzyme)